MTTTNDFNQTVFQKGATLEMILTYGIINGVDAMEKVIKTTYTKEDANYIITVINALN